MSDRGDIDTHMINDNATETMTHENDRAFRVLLYRNQITCRTRLGRSVIPLSCSSASAVDHQLLR